MITLQWQWYPKWSWFHYKTYQDLDVKLEHKVLCIGFLQMRWQKYKGKV